MDRNEFLQNYKKFQLGDLVTEQVNPQTKGLSELVQSDLPKALELLKAVDLAALKQFSQYAKEIESLRVDVQRTLKDGGRIFLVGCGATGRLSMLNEFLWREKHQNDQVISLMAGGDIALVHSLEGFEDYPEFGERHLQQLGFTNQDLLIGSSEGGETPYVIGAVETAAKISKRQPYFLFCNPESILIEKVQRSKDILQNPKVHSICLFVGPMTLSGSTRMQASTVLQLAIGLSLVEVDQPVEKQIAEFVRLIEELDFKTLAPLTKKEAQVYREGEFVMYIPHQLAITVFTDTTERAPTFNLPSFEKSNAKNIRPSLSYIQIPEARDSNEAWIKLLDHSPRPLNWPEIDAQTTSEYLTGFDFSREALAGRDLRLQGKKQNKFEIFCDQQEIQMNFCGVDTSFSLKTQSSLFRHTALKLLLNTHSTLLMGILGRYRSNVMTWVKPTNAKLIDRSARYIQALLLEMNIEHDYLDIVNKIFDCKSVPSDEPIVMQVVQFFLDQELTIL